MPPRAPCIHPPRHPSLPACSAPPSPSLPPSAERENKCQIGERIATGFWDEEDSAAAAPQGESRCGSAGTSRAIAPWGARLEACIANWVGGHSEMGGGRSVGIRWRDAPPAPASRLVLLAVICARDARVGGHQVLSPTVLLMGMLPPDVEGLGAPGSPMGSGHSWAASSLPKAGVVGSQGTHVVLDPEPPLCPLEASRARNPAGSPLRPSSQTSPSQARPSCLPSAPAPGTEPFPVPFPHGAGCCRAPEWQSQLPCCCSHMWVPPRAPLGTALHLFALPANRRLRMAPARAQPPAAGMKTLRVLSMTGNSWDAGT